MYSYFKRLAGNAPLKSKFFILTIFISIIPVTFLGFFSYSVSISYMEKSAMSAAMLKFEVINSRLERYLSDIDDTSLELISDGNIQKFFTSTDYSDRYIYENEVRKKLSSVLSSKDQIHSIVLYDLDGNAVMYTSNKDLFGFDKRAVTGKNIQEYDIYENITELQGKRIWTKLYEDTDKISLVRTVNEIGTQKQIGTLVINIFQSQIKDIIEGFSSENEGNFLIYEQSGNIIYSTDEMPYRDEILSTDNPVSGYKIENNGGEKYMNVYYSSQFCGWNMVSVILLKSLLSKVVIIKNITLVIIILCLIILVGFSMLTTSFLTKPIIKLSNLMRKAEHGDLDIKFDNDYNDEIGQLGQNFNSMIQKIKNLLNENVEKQKKLRAEELKALQMQINPHFLYNTMDTINWMAQSIDAESISNISIALANYYRLSLSKGAEIIKIKNEISHIQNYLTIQKIRYENHINYEMDISQDILSMFIIKLTLQPIVENAIYHGLREKDEGGVINIAGWLEGDRVVFEVKDNGKGMDEEQLSNLRDSLNGISSHGYGLSNVNERIRLYFGEEYGISIDSVENSYTMVRVTIPAITNEEEFLNF